MITQKKYPSKIKLKSSSSFDERFNGIFHQEKENKYKIVKQNCVYIVTLSEQQLKNFIPYDKLR